MRRILFSIAVFLLSLSSVMGQMIPINLPADGNWPTIVGDSIMLIGPRQNELTEEQRYFNPPYLLVYPGKEHLKEQMIRAALCDCDPTKPNRRIGVFSVAPDKQVSFSQGNLQYLPAANIWKFADTQYEYLGNANKYLKPTFRNWVDLFGWSANNTTAPFGVSTSTNAADYAGTFVDWGTNTICGDAPNTWRTLSRDEWEYLLNGRENAQQLRTKGSVEGKEGVILLPDSWICPEGYTIAIIPDEANLQPNVNTYSQADWSKLEDAGAIILPSAGMRRNAIEVEVRHPNIFGGYWTCTNKDEHNSYCYTFHTQDCEYMDYSNHIYGRSVRLVHDTIVPKPPKRIGVFSVAADKQVSFSQGNLQYTQSTDEWRFAREQYEYIGAENIKDGKLADKIDLFGWSANNTTAPFGVSTSMSASDYAGDFVDWGTSTICGDAPGTWRTLSVDEWGYLFQGRKNATQLYSKGNIDGLRGMIILPDNWVMPEGLHFTAQPTNLTMELDINTYTQAEWQRMEEAGAVFLCPTGRRDGTKIDYLEYYGGYWSSSKISNSNHVCHMYYNYKSKIFMTDYKEGDYSYGTNGRAVRLVHDTIVPETIPEPCLIVKVNDTLSINMMCVEGGTFMMGATENDTDAENDEYPQHQVTVSDFMIGQTEVTQELWTAVMGTNPSKNQGNYLPVEQVTWDECQEFVAKLNQLTGKHFRLPTEAEWEFAARGGNKSKGYKYSGSDNLSDVAWYDGNSGNKTHKVGTKQPNELGIFDMSGNVYEKCQDWYAPYTAEAQVNPQGPAEPQTYRVVRGGCSGSQATNNSERVCRVINRGYARTTSRESITGLRLVLDTAEYIPVPEPAKRIGVFSVAADKQVSFSQGNLQYVQSTDTWQFANNQLEYMGHKHFRNGQLADTIEYFGWSGKNSKAPWGISLSTESSDYEGEFLDWGTNSIAGSAPNTWRTLSNNEWLYICQGRKNADQLLGLGTIGTVTGLIILPDDWQLPAGLSFTPNTDNATKNQYTYNQWAVMENAGAVFIATSGYFNPKLGGMRHVGGEGHIRTNALSDNGLQVYSVIKTNKIIYSYSGTQEQNLQYAFAQRLVHDTIVPTPEPEYVDLGLSVKWATFNLGATSPEDYGDYFAWGETEPKETYSWATYKWGDGTDANITKYNSTDGKTILESADDAAQVHWGGKWRMPTKEEIEELIDNCTWSESIQNGVKGYVVTSKYTGNSIFFPYSGYFNHDNSATLQGEKTLFYTWSAEHSDNTRGYDIHNRDGAILLEQNTRRCGFPIRPVYDDRPTLTVIPTPEDAKVSFLCKGYQAVGHSITVDKGKNVLYQVSNVDAGYLSQGDSIYNLTKDTTLYVTLRPFSDGNWVKVDKSEYTKQEGYYVSRNNGGFASHSVWNYYVLPVLPGETYRVRGIAGQHAALWMAASTAPDAATNTRPTKISCCANRGVAAYVADEVTIPDGTKYLIINSRSGQEIMVERKVPDPCLVVKVNDTLSINMMCVEGGTFMMGAMEGDTQAKENEKPAHKVTLTYDYLIMQTEVTQGLWEAVMGEDIYDLISKSSSPTAKPISTRGDFPVGYVQLSQCLEFIDRLNELTGMHFRMPTEAEWEYAARGGNQSKGYLYAGSNTLTQVAQTSLGTVAKLLPNELGIYDMSGNIAEMTLDYLPNHETGYPSANAQVNPRQISPTGNRAIRGLRWNTTEINCRISHRNAYTTTYSGNGMGFRLVLSNEQNFRTIHINGSYFDMSFVKGGTFMMGSDAPDAQADEQPVHEVTLSDYYIGQTEVTQHLWKKVMGEENNPSAVKGNNLPVTNITWDEAQTFVERLSELTGMRFRLPTEAEWEYAARGGQKSKGYTYAGGDDIEEVGWYNGNSSNKTHAVGQKQPNELGIYDMTGNVWEYCSDWHMPYSAQAQTNPTGAVTGEKHVLRGGCYHYDSKNCTNTNRHSYYTPDKGGASTGLRIVLESQRYYRYGYTLEDWDAATDSWGHQGRGHAPADQSCIQGTMVRGIRLKVASAGSLNVYKVPSLLEKNEDHFELVATLTTDSMGVQDFDFAEPIYIAPNEYLVFGKPSEKMPTLRPYYANHLGGTFPIKAKAFAHYVGTDKAKVSTSKSSLMVEFY